MIRPTAFLALLVVLSTAASAQVAPADTVSSPADAAVVASPESLPDREGPPPGVDAVLLRSGEWLVGDVRLQPSAERPRHAMVDGARIELSHMAAYRVGGRHYVVLTHYPQDFPRVLMRTEHGPIELFREPRQTTGADFYRHDGARIQLLTGRNLRADLGGHPEALEHLRLERFAAFLGTTSFVVGLGLVATGVAIQLDYVESPLSGPIVAGTGVGVAALVNAMVPGIRRQARLAAVRAYNR